MGVFLCIIAIIVTFIFFSNLKKKNEIEAEKIRTTPGVALFIRDNFNEIVSCVSSIPDITKDFERNGYIRYINNLSGQRVVLQQWSGKLLIAVDNNKVLQGKWEIDKNDITPLLISEIKRVIGSYSYWEDYKIEFPQKAVAIMELVQIDMDKETDQKAREIVDAIELWSKNRGLPISQLKQEFIDYSIEKVGAGNLDILVDSLENFQEPKEKATSDSRKHKIMTKIMISVLKEYMQKEKERKVLELAKKKVPKFEEFDVQQKKKELNLAPDISKNNNKENRLVELLDECCDHLSKDFLQLDKIGRAEAILMFSTQVMDYGIIKNDIDMDIFEDRFKLLLFDKVSYFDDKGNEFDFLNSRVGFYKQEISKISKDANYVPLALINTIYINPGCDNPEDIQDKNPKSVDINEFKYQVLNLVNYILLSKNNI